MGSWYGLMLTSWESKLPNDWWTRCCQFCGAIGYHSSNMNCQESATIPVGVDTDQSIFSLNLSRIQIPTVTSVSNCNHKYGPMLTCRHDIDTFTWGYIVLSLPKRAHVDWNWPILREKYLKLDSMICYNAVALAYYGSCRFPVMDSWNCLKHL